MRVFSFGGGVQSVAALVLAAHGEMEVDAFVFANVGEDSENPDTLRYIDEIAKPFAQRHKLQTVEVRKRRKDGVAETLYQKLNRPQSKTLYIPVRIGSGGIPARRSCTNDFKIQPIASWCYRQGARKKNPATTMLGITIDEYQRMRTDSGISYTRLEYPLVDRLLTRTSCMHIISMAGLPIPPKSSCWFCPYHSRAAWRELSIKHPDLFAKAVVLEEMLSKRAQVIHAHRANYQGENERVWFSSSLKPLVELEAHTSQLLMFPDDTEDACESGYCMV
jgi:hypothetical protein